MALDATFTLTGAGTLTPATAPSLESPVSALNIGDGEWDEALSVTFADGNGSGQAETWYSGERIVAATTADNLDLSGVLSNVFGVSIAAVKVKWIILAIVTPDGTKTIRIGPRNQANAWQGPWGGTGATVYQDVTHWQPFFEPVNGWSVTAGTGDILGIYNPSAVSVTYRIWIGVTITP